MTDSYSRTRGQFTVSTDKSRLDLAMIHDFLTHSYWARNVPMAIVQKSIANSLCFGVYDEQSSNGPRQIGFARIVSDLATFAYLADVFVIEEYRGRGLGKWLVECIMAHPDLQGLRRFLLATSDAHGLYAQFGFEKFASLEDAHRLMFITKPNIYQAP